MGDRTVFDLRKLYRTPALSRGQAGVLHAACLLILGRIWNEVKRTLPRRQKAVLIGEMWPYAALPTSAGFLEDVSRRARKRNVVLLIVSRRIEDFLSSPSGRAVMKNSATKVLLKQDEASIDSVAETFGLSGAEKKACLAFPRPSRKKPAEGIFMRKEARVPVKFAATDEEYELFTAGRRKRVGVKSGGQI